MTTAEGLIDILYDKDHVCQFIMFSMSNSSSRLHKTSKFSKIQFQFSLATEVVYTSEILKTSFDLPKVEMALGKHFKLLDHFDDRAYKNVNYDSKVFFLCRLSISNEDAD